MKDKRHDPQAMERRIMQCCEENPDCSFAERCYRQYVKFVNSTNDLGLPSAKKAKVGRSAIETYKFHGRRSISYGIPLRC